MIAGEKLLQVATRDAGYNATSTHSKFTDWYGYRGYWCAMSVSYWASKAGILGTIVPKHAYTPNGVAWYKRHGRFHNGTAGIHRGDCVYFSFGRKRVDHVGIFVGWSKGRIVTFDGNTGRSHGRSGGQVKYATRNPYYVVGYGDNHINIGAASTAHSDKPAHVSIDGWWGPATTRAIQWINTGSGAIVDGVVSSQPAVNEKYLPHATSASWKFVRHAEGSLLVKILQRAWGATPDGYMGANTVKAMQRYYGVAVDGIMGNETVTAFQKAINNTLDRM